MQEEVSPEELRRCLDAISRHAKGASEVVSSPGEVYVHTSPGGRYVYINFAKPSEVPAGSTYRTWVVRLEGGRPDGVTFYRSRRGAGGDETLPPED